MNFNGFTITHLLKRTYIRAAIVNCVSGWNGYNTECGCSILDKRNAHAELTILIYKLFRAIERINKPKFFSLKLLQGIFVVVFFTYYWCFRKKLRHREVLDAIEQRKTL